MAHHTEPMDVDCIDSDFDNKENFHHSNVLPCTEKGYEELDVCELNMKLRYSITPATSPMSKSYTADDTKNLDYDDSLVCINENSSLTRSLNSTITRNDSVIKSLKALPLQTISTEIDNNRSSVLRQLDSTLTSDYNVISGPNDDENLSLPSSSSSAIHTPEATTPSNLSKDEEESTIIRGLKTVFNMFRSSQSTVLPTEDDNVVEQLIGCLDETYCEDQTPQTLATTPIAVHRNNDGSTSKRSSPLKDSIVFNDDLEKELQWKKDTTLSSEEKLPIQKLFPQMKPIPVVSETSQKEQLPIKDLNSNPVERMDISYNNSYILDSSVSEILNTNGESDCEFVDCETTFAKNVPQEVESKKESDASDNLIVTKVIVNNSNLTDKEYVTTENQKDVASSALDLTREMQNNNLTLEVADTKDINLTNAIKNLDKTSIQGVSSGFVTLDATEEIINEHESKKSVKGDEIEKNVDVAVENSCEVVPVVCELDPAKTASNIQVKNIEISTLNKLEHIPTEVEQEAVISQMNATVPCMDEIGLLEQNLKQGSVTIENLNISNEIIQTDVMNFEVNAELSMLDKDIRDSQIVDDINNSDDIKTDEAESERLVPKIECALNSKEIESVESVANKNQNSSVNSTDSNTEEDTIKSSWQDTASIKIIELPGPDTQLPEIAEGHVVHAQAPNEKPADIPLPEDEDFDCDLGHNTPDVLDTVKTKAKLDMTLEGTKVIENTTGQIPENHDLLDETNAIVNSLTEIIGESPNNTIVLANNTFEHTLSELMNSVEFSDEAHVLPDLVNQTVTNLNEPEDSETVSTPFNDTISHITYLHKSELDTVVAENTTVRNNESFTLDEKLKAGVKDASKMFKNHSNNVEIAPDENVCQYDSVVKIKDTNKSPIVDEEFNLSENNSPYVSVIAKTEPKPTDEIFNEIDIQINATNELPKPTDEIFNEIDIQINVTNELPSSPPIKSKGYNFNFDEIDDPFATKTKISLSPPSTPSKLEKENKEETKKSILNRRRPQPPEKEIPPFNKKNNTTNISSSVESPINKLNDLNSKGDSKKEIDKNIINTTDTMDIDITVDNEVTDILDSTKVSDQIKMTEETINVSSVKDVDNLLLSQMSMENKSSLESLAIAKSDIKLSSSEQSTYYSAATSSDSLKSKNVFNLPEIEDMNFNPFATTSKMRQSPQHNLEPESPYKSKIIPLPDSAIVISPNSENMQHFAQISKDPEDKMDTELMEKDSAYNITNTSSSSKGTDDINITAREVNTEDEDTEEGPFIEVEDAKLLNNDEDLLQFNEIPTHANEENADGEELFIDAETFEFLLNKNQTNVVADSGKESLFLKFDPLFAKRISSDGVLAALKHVQKRQSTSTNRTIPSLRNEASPIADPSTMNTTYEGETNVTQDSVEDLNVTVAKPMMVVTPAVNPAVTARTKTTTPPRSNRRSFTFTSPAMAVIDRLLSLSGNNSFVGPDTTVTHASREHSEADVALSHLRELLAEKENTVDQLRSESKELKFRLSTMETQVKILEADGQERLSKINKLNDRIAEKTKINKSMAAVVEEYERTIASLIADTEQDKKRHAAEKNRLINERDEQTSHLASMEVSFSDLHSKYEKVKQIILSCKANEETYKKSNKEFEENLAKMQANYETLKQHATLKLNNANMELQKINKAHESDIVKLNAMIKRNHMHITSLEETLAQKTKANEELTAICDELINKVA